MCSVTVDTDRNKRGQTSRSVVRAQIQTSCNFEANLCAMHLDVVCVYYRFNGAFLEWTYKSLGCLH